MEVVVLKCGQNVVVRNVTEVQKLYSIFLDKFGVQIKGILDPFLLVFAH